MKKLCLVPPTFCLSNTHFQHKRHLFQMQISMIVYLPLVYIFICCTWQYSAYMVCFLLMYWFVWTHIVISFYYIFNALHWCPFRETLNFQCKEGYYGAWNENQMDFSTRANYNFKVVAPSENVLWLCSKYTRGDNHPFRTYKMLSLTVWLGHCHQKPMPQ